MKKNFLTGIVVAMAAAVGMTSCSDDSSSIGAGMGRISPTVIVDSDIITASKAPASRANEDVTVSVSDLKLKLTSDDGSFSQEWESVDDFDETQDFKVGDYTLEAYYGREEDAEGYAKPHFHGSQAISVKFDQTTKVALNAELKNSRVFVRYTEAFKDYMASYSVQIHTPKGKYVTMAGDEVSPVYVTPGMVNVNLTFTKPNGKNATIEAARFQAKAKTEHVVTIDINGGDSGADATLKVMFDDTVDTEDIEIDLSDDLLDAPEPEITTEGWTSGEKFPHIEYSPAPGQVKASIIAPGKIASVILSVSSPSLKSLGWPDEPIDLVAANEATIALLTSTGLKGRGIWTRPDMMGVLDFTDLFTHLGVGTGQTKSTHTFSIQVKDRYGKLSQVHEFEVETGLGQVEIHSATAEIGFKNIDAVVEYNGANNLADVSFQLRNLYSAWEDLKLTDAKPVAGQPGYYNVKLTSPSTIQSTQTLRATFGSTHSDLALEVTTPSFELHVSENDVFAHKAIVTVDCAEADDAAVAKQLTLTVNGRDYDHYETDEADIFITGLRAGTAYTIEAKSANHSASVTFTTETEDHLPGCEENEAGDHYVGFATAKWTGTRMGGSTSNCLQYNWKVEGWATMNDLTTKDHGTGIGSAAITGGASFKATSGTIPANGRSTQSAAGGGLAGMTKHSDGHTTGNASLHNNRQHGGTNAALIRTVGWGSGNACAAGTSSNIGFGNPAKCNNRTQGELYLGTYDNGPQYGYAFTSRPSALSFYYHYDPAVSGNNDYGTAEIHVYDADGEEISHSEVMKLQENTADRWTDLTKKLPYTLATIPITYERGAKKAAKISIIFRSTRPDQTENPALKDNNTYYWNTPGGNNTSGGEYVGSELYIDDVRLTY